MAEAVETVVMRFEPDDAASKRTEQAVARLRSRVKGLSADLKGLRAQASGLNQALDGDNQALGTTAQNVARLRQRGQQLKTTLSQVRQEIEGQTRAWRAQDKAVRQLSVVGTQTRALGYAASAAGLPGVGQAVATGSQLFEVNEAALRLGKTLPELSNNLGLTRGGAAALGLEMVALAGAMVIIKELASDITDGATATKAAVVGQIDALQEYNDFIQTATSDDLRTRLDELTQTRAAKGQLVEDLYELKNAIESGLDVSGGGAVDTLAEGAVRALDAIGLMGFGLDELDEAIAQTNAELTSTDTQFRLLTQAFMDGATAANDAAQREREYTQATLDGLERRAQVEIDAATMTEEQVDKRIAAIEAETVARQKELDALQQLEQSGQVVDQIEAVNDRLAELGEEARLLDSIARPLAQANDAVALAEKNAAIQATELAKNVEIAHKVYAQAAVDQAKLNDQLQDILAERATLDAEYAQESLEIQQDRDLKLAQEAEKFALDQVNDLADHYKDLAKIDKDYYSDRSEILSDVKTDLGDIQDDLLDDLADYNRASQRAAEDHQDRLTQIQSRARTSIRDAARKLDAQAIIAAKDRAKEELESENDKYDKEKRRRDEDFNDLLRSYEDQRTERQNAADDALRDLEQRHEQERQETISAFNEQLRREDQQRTLEQQHQDQQWALQDQRREQQYQAERDQLGKHYSRLLTLTADGLFQVETAYQAWLDSMAARGGTVGPTVPISQTPIAVGGAGGFPPLDRDVLVGDTGPEIIRFLHPARIYPPGQRPGSMSIGDVIVNMPPGSERMDLAAVGAVFHEELIGFLQEMAA